MEETTEVKKIEIEDQTLAHLNTARKWAMFLAIMGFIFLGLMIVIGFIAGTFLKTFSSAETGSAFTGSLVYIPLVIGAVIYFFPVLFLFRFSKFSAKAVRTYDKLDMHKAIKNLKYYFAYFGILVIVMLVIYFIMLVIAGSSLAFLKGL